MSTLSYTTRSRQRHDTPNDSIPPQTNPSSDTQLVQHASATSRSTPPSVEFPATSSSWRPSRQRADLHRQNNTRPLRLRWASRIRWSIILLCLSSAVYVWSPPRQSIAHALPQEWRDDPTTQQILQPSSPGVYHHKRSISPEQWLREHSENGLRDSNAFKHTSDFSLRPKAALISLVRNEELEGILQSMRQLEFHWNRRYRYPWIFFSEKPFSEEFKVATTNATTASTSYHLIPRPHWSTPTWVDHTRYHDSLSYLHTISVGKGHLPSYRHMCRWNSGFFYQHPALAQYDYYWRVEPDVHFFCDIPYDPFQFMQENEMVYGFNMNILDDARSFASLWRYTRRFMEENPGLVHPDADLRWLVDEENGGEYNNCQFFSNFEIGSLEFFRGEANARYFQYLDEVAEGFFYERYGDAPIHTLSIAMFAPKDKVWFFRDIGYQHDIARHCPADGVASGRCACEATGLDENFYKLVPMESPQRKPPDSCIRLWLGGEWLETKDGWDQEMERLVGGDGYGGYVKDVV